MLAARTSVDVPPPERVLGPTKEGGLGVAPFWGLVVPKREAERVIPGEGVARVLRSVGRVGVVASGEGWEGVETARRAGVRRVTRGVVAEEG
jgi:hypothetical protein